MGKGGSVADYDLVTFGETMIRLSTPTGHRLETTSALDIGIGGTESNVAIALARLGRSVAWTSGAATQPLRSPHRRGTATARRGRSARPLGRPRSSWRLLPRYGDAATTDPRHLRPGCVGRCDVRCRRNRYVDRGTLTRLLHLTGITPALSPACAEIARGFAARAIAAGIPDQLRRQLSRAALDSGAGRRDARALLLVGDDPLLWPQRRAPALGDRRNQ